jgi:CheY-like chemotaxis protein
MASKNLGAVIQRAISDGAFRRQLQSDPAAALRGFNLTPDEVAAIRSADSSKLMSLGVDQRMSKAFSVSGMLGATRATTSDLSAGGSAEENLALRTQELNNFADLAGRSAHELNNMLTVIRMNADLIEGTLNQAKLSAGEAVDIRNAADRAEALTKKLLLASRRTLPQPTGLDRGVVTVPLPGSPLKESQEEVVARESLEAQAGRVGRLKHGAPTGKETILLVDDEKALRKLGKRVLNQAGYRVLEASDGAMALRIAAEEVGEIDLVLTDIEMPTLGGRGMVDELHEMSPEIRVLFMSGYTDNEILRRGIRTSETDFLQKPFTAEALCAAVRSVLAKPATPSA